MVNKTKAKTKKKKTQVKRLSKKQKSILPTHNECKNLDKWHFPWNASKYKEKCVNKKCIWNQTLFGSECNDPITITNNRINSRGLNNGIIISKINNQDILSRIIEECNVADEKHANNLKKYYFKFRIDNIKDIVTNDINNNLIYCSNEDLRIIYSNALKENIKISYNLNHLIMLKNNLQTNCYHENIGNNPMFYRNKLWFTVLNRLENCGIRRNTRLYNVTFTNWNRFSVHSPLNIRKRKREISRRRHEESRRRHEESRRRHEESRRRKHKHSRRSHKHSRRSHKHSHKRDPFRKPSFRKPSFRKPSFRRL